MDTSLCLCLLLLVFCYDQLKAEAFVLKTVSPSFLFSLVWGYWSGLGWWLTPSIQAVNARVQSEFVHFIISSSALHDGH